MKFSFKTRKLKGSVKKINARVKSVPGTEDLTVFGVSNKKGICVTGKEVSADVSNYIHVKGKKFAYNPYRINVGSIGLADQSFEGIVSPAYVVFETEDDINDEFLFLYLRSPLGINLISWYGNRGGVRSALRFKDLEKIDFPDLTYEQQTKALEIIRTQFEKIDDVSEELVIQKSLIDKLRQSILQDAIQGKLVPQDPNDEPASELLKRIKAEKDQLVAEKKIKKSKPFPPITEEEKTFVLPQGWEWSKLGELGFIQGGGTPSKSKTEFWDGAIPWVCPKDMKRKFLDSSICQITEDAIQKSSAKKIPVRSVLFVVRGMILGHTFPVGISIEDLTVNQDMKALSPYLQGLEEYIYLALICLSPQILKLVERSGHGTCRLESDKYINFLVPVPPEKEQKKVIKKVEELMKFCEELEQQMQKSSQLGERLSQSVLQQAFVQG